MSNLAVVDNYAPALSEAQRAMIVYSNGLKVGTMQKNHLKDHFYNFIEKAIFNCGQANNFSDEHMIILTKDFIDMSKVKFKGLTIQEIGRALHKGSIGDFGDFYGINLKTLRTWLDSYKEERREAKRTQINHDNKLLMETKEPTDEEKKAIREEFIEECFNKPMAIYRKSGHFTFKNTPYLFKLLEEKGDIDLTREEKMAYMSKAEIEYVARLKAPAGSMDEKRKLSRLLKEFEAGSNPEHDIKSIAKELAFKNYIIKLIEQENDI